MEGRELADGIGGCVGRKGLCWRATTVKLRYENKVYAGKGVSTDVIGASIRAYIDAVNKICYEAGVS